MTKHSSKSSEKTKKDKSAVIRKIVNHVDWYMYTWCEKSQSDRIMFTNSEIFRVSGCLLTELSHSEQADLCALLWGRGGYDATISGSDLMIYGWARK